jgi:hypothetical protein
VKRIKEAQVLEVIDQLSNFAAQQKNDELRGIASIGKLIEMHISQLIIGAYNVTLWFEDCYSRDYTE